VGARRPASTATPAFHRRRGELAATARKASTHMENVNSSAKPDRVGLTLAGDQLLAVQQRPVLDKLIEIQ